MKFDFFIFRKLALGNNKGPSAAEIVRLSEEIVNTQKVSRHTISGIILTASKWDNWCSSNEGISISSVTGG